MNRFKSHRRGATLVEMLVCLMLISILMTMAAASLSSASKIFVRIQKTQYAQSVLDTVMTELRTLTKDATGYVKIYENSQSITDTPGTTSEGDALEFMNSDGYAVLLTSSGCEQTNLYIGDQMTGTADAVTQGQLLARYYFVDSDDHYAYSVDGQPAARAVAAVFGQKFYMGNYLKVTYRIPSVTTTQENISRVTATVELYSDADYKNLVAADSEILEFRYPMKFNAGYTAVAK